ncbi:MAG: hypothetical protein U1A78_41985 [Polyangia bacterium]
MSPVQTEAAPESVPPADHSRWDEAVTHSRLSFVGLRLLVVDDEQDSREFLAFMLAGSVRAGVKSNSCSGGLLHRLLRAALLGRCAA